jgi:2-amino-4-hydroxy-6-hydroxymethyldihydropteridine diphosphokinase
MADYYILLGSNQGDRIDMLNKATEQIQKVIGPVKAMSSVYETEPWGVENQENFLNQALIISCNKNAAEVWEMVKNIQNNLGKTQEIKWGPRNIDIDILYCDDLVLNTTELTIPHPRLYERNFVLVPLIEIAGDFTDPVHHVSIDELFDRCKDSKEVFLYE